MKTRIIVCEGFNTLCTLSRASFRAVKKVLNPESNTLPKQHTPSLQRGIVDLIRIRWYLEDGFRKLTRREVTKVARLLNERPNP